MGDTFFSEALTILAKDRDKLLTQPIFDAIKEHPLPQVVAQVLFILNEEKILSENDPKEVSRHINLSALLEGLNSLKRAALPLGDYYKVIKPHQNPFALAEGLVTLSLQVSVGFLNKYQAAVNSHDNPKKLAWALVKLHYGEILEGSNEELIIQSIGTQDKPLRFATELLGIRDETGQLTKEDIESVSNRLKPNGNVSPVIEAASLQSIFSTIQGKAATAIPSSTPVQRRGWLRRVFSTKG